MQGNLFVLFILLVVFFVIWFFSGITPKQRNKRVKMYIRYARKEHELYVRLESSGKLPVEIVAPEIKFYDKVSSRAFTIKPQGMNLFPLNLFPQTDYEFRIDLQKFYSYDNSLQQYKRAKLIVHEKTGRLLKFKRIWL